MSGVIAGTKARRRLGAHGADALPKLLPFNLGVADRRLRGGDRAPHRQPDESSAPPPARLLASRCVPMNGPPATKRRGVVLAPSLRQREN